MSGKIPNESPPLPPRDLSALRRIAAAIAISTLLHLAIALFMKPSFLPVNDFAVDFEIVNMTDAPPKPAPPAPEPEPEPEKPQEPVKEAPKRKPKPKPKAVDPAPKIVPVDVSTDEVQVAAADTDTGTDKGEAGTGICMHDLFAYTQEQPTWLLYVVAGAFRDSVYERELTDTFNSFELGRRLGKLTGLNLTRDVESLFVEAENIFDWKTYQISLSHDLGEEALMARIKAQQKQPDFEWQKTDDGFTAALPGQFRWDMISSGRVMSIAYEPERVDSPPKIPGNPFAAEDTETGAAQALGTDAEIAPTNEAATASSKADETARPKQVECIAVEKAGQKKNPKKEPSLAEGARMLMAPDEEGHWPVAVLSTSDPRAVGLGTRQGKKMGFVTASVRGYFTEPVRIEGYMQFSKDPAAVEALAENWRKEAARFAADPFLAIAGVSALLKNLKITTEGEKLRFSLEMNHGQVLSTLMFLQLQGKALERQLLSD